METSSCSASGRSCGGGESEKRLREGLRACARWAGHALLGEQPPPSLAARRISADLGGSRRISADLGGSRSSGCSARSSGQGEALLSMEASVSLIGRMALSHAKLERRCGVPAGEMRGDVGGVGRCGEMRGDVGRCGEMWGGVGRYGSQVRLPACGEHASLGAGGRSRAESSRAAREHEGGASAVRTAESGRTTAECVSSRALAGVQKRVLRC